MTADHPNGEDHRHHSPPKARHADDAIHRLWFWGALAFSTLLSTINTVIIMWQVLVEQNAFVLCLVQSNIPVFMGIPLAANGAFQIVIVLDQVSRGSLEFEALTFKFRGSSGPVALWVLCFFVSLVGIKLLWMPMPGIPAACKLVV